MIIMVIRIVYVPELDFSMSTLLAKNAEVLVTMDGERRELKDAGLYAEEGIIKQVGPNGELPGTADTVIDLTGQIVLPGFVNTHHHLNQTLTRNLPAAQNNNLFPWLQGALPHLGAHHGGGLARQHADRPGRARAVRLHDRLRPQLRVQERQQRRLPDRGGKRSRRALSRQPRLDVARRIQRRPAAGRLRRGRGLHPQGQPARHRDLSRCVLGSMTQIVLAPCSPFSVTTSLLKESAALARQYKVKLHTHLCETLDEERYTLEHFQLRPVDWMETLGWLGDDVWFAHAIHVDDDEIRKFAADRLRRGALPVLQHAARLRHRARSRNTWPPA